MKLVVRNDLDVEIMFFLFLIGFVASDNSGGYILSSSAGSRHVDGLSGQC